jgi:hypothetical protein
MSYAVAKELPKTHLAGEQPKLSSTLATSR